MKLLFRATKADWTITTRWLGRLQTGNRGACPGREELGEHVAIEMNRD